MAFLSDIADKVKKLFEQTAQTTAQGIHDIPANIRLLQNNPQQFAYGAALGADKLAKPINQALTPVVQNRFNPFYQTQAVLSMNPQQAQQFRQDVTNFVPRANIPRFKIQNPIGNFAANLPINIGEGLINTLPNAVAGAAKLPAARSFQQGASDLASIAEAPFTVATFGGLGAAKDIAEQGAEQAIKQGFKQTLKKGAISGAKYGGAYGALEGFKTGENIKSPVDYSLNLLGKTVSNAAVGGALGGGSAALGYGFGKIRAALAPKAPNGDPTYVDKFFRDEIGRFASKKKPAPNEPVWVGDMRESLGLPRNGNFSETELVQAVKNQEGFIRIGPSKKPIVSSSQQAKIPISKLGKDQAALEKSLSSDMGIEGGSFSNPMGMGNAPRLNPSSQTGSLLSGLPEQPPLKVGKSVLSKDQSLASDLATGELKSNTQKQLQQIAKEGPKLSNKSSSSRTGIGNEGVVPMNRISPPQVDLTTNKTQVLPQLSELPSTQGGGPQNLSSGNIIADPVQKVIDALKGAKPIRGQQEKIYAKIRAQQAGAISGIGSKMGGEAGYFQKLGQLKGELPKVSFESIKKQLTQDDINALFNTVEQANLPTFQKLNAQTGLRKLLGEQGGTIPTRSELALLNEVFPPEFIQAVLNNRSSMQKLFAAGEDALNIPRAIMATADMSAPMRQGVFLAPTFPKEWGAAFGTQLKSFFSKGAYEKSIAAIKTRPTYQAMREGGLALTDTGPLLSTREESFMSNFVEKIPGFGKVAQGSNRAYSGFLNKLRADVFDNLYTHAKNEGILQDNPGVINDIARFVNTATGRGDLGALNRAAPVLNGLLFSPRLVASRLQTLNPLYYTSLDPFVRKQALKSLVGFAGTAGTILGLAKMGGAEVGIDPRNSDFGKIKVGNTRYDILGGFQQPLKLASQLISGKLISSTTGKEYTLGEGYKPLTRKDILLRFFENKESPVASFISGLLQGSNNTGESFNTATETIKRFIPMIAQDMYDVAKEAGSPLGALLATPGIFGVGVQTYGKQIANAQSTPTGRATIKLSPVPGLAEDIVNRITGQQVSNIPQDQQQAFIDSKTKQTQNQVAVDKVKQQLDAGKTPTGGATQATFTIDGIPTQGYQVGNSFVYVNQDGQTTTSSLKSIKSGELSYQQANQNAQYSLDAQRYQQANNLEGFIKATSDQIKSLQDYQKQLDPVSDKAKITSTQNTIEDLQTKIAKFKGYGGFTKPKKPKKVTIKASKVKKAPTIKIAALKAPTIAKPPAFKTTKSKKPKALFKVSKAKKLTFKSGQSTLGA